MHNTYKDLTNYLEECHLRRGAATVVSGFEHNFKTGFSIETMVRCAHDQPRDITEAVENMILATPADPEVLVELLASLIEKVTGTALNQWQRGLVSKADFVSGWFLGRGYRFLILRRALTNPNGSLDFFLDEVRALNDDQPLRLLVVDDLEEMVHFPDWEKYQMGIRYLRHIAQEYDGSFLFHTPFSQEAKELYVTIGPVTDDGDDFLDLIAFKSYYKHGRFIDREVDNEIHLRTDHTDKEGPSLKVLRGKCRGAPPMEDGKKEVFTIPFSKTHAGLV